MSVGETKKVSTFKEVIKMYINPIFFGVILTLLVEFVGFIVIAITKNNKEDK